MDLFAPLLDRSARMLEQPALSRRRFFNGLAGVSAATLIAGCDTDDDSSSDVVLDFSTDVGVLNYAYALEQLEAAFYTQVVATPFTGATATELEILRDVKAHEVIHRDFFKAALGTNAIGSLSVNFSAINFADRASVLGTAKAFEDLGVAAYNGAGRYLKSADYLTIAGKIVSVEARHAAVMRALLNPGSKSFADVSDLDGALGANSAFGLDAAARPALVLSTASPFIATSITLKNA